MVEEGEFTLWDQKQDILEYPSSVLHASMEGMLVKFSEKRKKEMAKDTKGPTAV